MYIVSIIYTERNNIVNDSEKNIVLQLHIVIIKLKMKQRTRLIDLAHCLTTKTLKKTDEEKY